MPEVTERGTRAAEQGPLPPQRLTGRVAVVTGAAQGIGAAVARRLVAEGASVVLADIQAQRGGALAAQLGQRAVFCRADATVERDWTALIGRARDHFGGLDILVNNAGGAFGLVEIADEALDTHTRTLTLNVTSCWLGIRAATPALTERGGGSIVNISSIDGLAGVAGMGTYSAAKFAVTGLTRTAALEVGRHGIRVNSVHPGMIGTPLVLDSGEAVLDRLARAIAGQPIPRLGDPDEVAAAVAFFASNDSSYCTGAALVVDGGHLAGPPREPLAGR